MPRQWSYAPKRSFITSERILIIQTICVARRFYSRRFPARYSELSYALAIIGRRQKKWEIKNVLHRPSWQNNNYFLMRLLRLCCADARLCHATSFRSTNALIFNEMCTKLHDENGHICIFSTSSLLQLMAHGFAGLVSISCPFELLNCVKQTMRILGHALIVNEYLYRIHTICAREIILRCYAKRDRCRAFGRAMQTWTLSTEFNAFKASHRSSNTRSKNHQKERTIRDNNTRWRRETISSCWFHFFLKWYRCIYTSLHSATHHSRSRVMAKSIIIDQKFQENGNLFAEWSPRDKIDSTNGIVANFS